MNCCSQEGTDRLFSRISAKHERRFRRRGLDRAQRHLLKGLSRAGVHGKTILDIGCGVGGLHLTLLRQGAASAVGVDISEGMIQRARALAGNLRVEDQVRYLRGDFLDLTGDIASSDIVMLDKVVCCYPDVDRLTAASIAKSKEVYALSYPRKSFLGWVAFGVPAFLGRLFRWSFRSYYHKPAKIIRRVTKEGFNEVYSAATWIWEVRVFRRNV